VSCASVVRGPGAAAGAGHHGAGAAGERSGGLSPGRHALPAGLLPGQDGRSVLQRHLRGALGSLRIKHSKKRTQNKLNT